MRFNHRTAAYEAARGCLQQKFVGWSSLRAGRLSTGPPHPPRRALARTRRPAPRAGPSGEAESGHTRSQGALCRNGRRAKRQGRHVKRQGVAKHARTGLAESAGSLLLTSVLELFYFCLLGLQGLGLDRELLRERCFLVHELVRRLAGRAASAGGDVITGSKASTQRSSTKPPTLVMFTLSLWSSVAWACSFAATAQDGRSAG